MTIIIPTKGSATSGLLDIWQAHIQQQQADKAQAAAKAAGASGNAANATNTTNVTGVRASANAAEGTDAPSDGDTILASLRNANEGAKQAGKAMAGGASGAGGASDASGAGNSIAADTIKKLKEMLAKVMAQLDAVRNNDSLPPEEKLQQITALSSEAMAIQGQITALMDPTKTSGTRVNTTA